MSSGQLCQKLAKDVRYPRLKQKYSTLCENFMRKLLSSEAKYRFATAADALQHPWIEYALGLQSEEDKNKERQQQR